MTSTRTPAGHEAGRSSSSGRLAPFLRPDGIALVGVSRDGTSVTARPAKYLTEYGYDGPVVIVNPSAGEELHGHRCVSRLADVEGECDVALVMVPATRLVQALNDCASSGIMNAVSIASGFEGSAGRGLREDLERFLAANPSFRLVGPNSAGLIISQPAAILSFSSVLQQEKMRPGRVGLVTQSGAVGNGLHLALLRRGTGISHWVSTGNEFDLGAIEVATEILMQPECATLGIFLEGMTDAEHLDALGKCIEETGKPVVALRAGASAAGRHAAFGHTGRVIGNDEIARASLEQAGVHLVDTIEELCDVLTVTSVLQPRLASGPAAVGVVTVSGGTGVIAADRIAEADGLVLAELGDASKRAIFEEVNVPTTVDNPYDVPTLGDPQVFCDAIRAMVSHAECEVVMAIVSSLAHDYELLATTDFGDRVPIVFCHLSPEERFDADQARVLAGRGIATVASPSNAVRSIAQWAGRHRGQLPSPGRPSIAPLEPSESAADQRRVGLVEALEILGESLAQWAAPVQLVTSTPQALDVAEKLGTPVAIKADGAAIGHRTELGAVRTRLSTREEIEIAYQEVADICGSYGDRVVMQAMARPGIEVLISVVRDPEVGHAVVCRPGGTLVELVSENAVLTGPPEGWLDIIASSPLGRLLAGYRGSRPGDTGALLTLMTELLDSARRNPCVAVIECNPVLVHARDEFPPSGCNATLIDVSVVLDESP